MGRVLPIDVAQFIINWFSQKHQAITTLKLQKLVYYSQAWAMVWDDQPLFDEDFEAWVNGPVVISLFHALKGNYFTPSFIVGSDISKLTTEQTDTIEHVLEDYSNYTSSELVLITHQEEPWIKARKGLGEREPGHNIIPKESILDYYLSQYQEGMNVQG